MTEKEYRALPIDSYSSFKDFLEDRKKYYKKYVLGEKVAEKEDLAIKMGNLVDALCFSPEEFDMKFHLSACSKAPTGNMLEFTEALYRRSVEASDEEGVLQKPLEEVMMEAYNDVKYDANGNIVAFKQSGVGSFEKIVERFSKECKDYYDELLATRQVGKLLVTPNDLTNAERIKDELFTNINTSSLMRLRHSKEIEVEHQVPVIFEILDYPVKGLIDKRIINHTEKWIQPSDLKVTWNVENFQDGYYFYRRSDLQSAIYYMGCLDYRDKNYPDYEVRPIQFIVADSINYMAPLIYTTTEQDVHDAITGYEYKGREYKGLSVIIGDLKWHKENDIWNISRENFTNNGVCKIKR